MANILDLVKEVEKMNVPRPYSNDPDISQFLHGRHKEYTEDKKRLIGDMDKSKLDVFGEKSKDFDDKKGEAQSWLNSFLFGPEDIDMGYAPDLALSPLISRTGIMATLKKLLGKAKSKAKFPVGYGELTKRPISELGLSDEAIGLRNLLLSPKTKEPLQKGMRQFGKFNRQKWEK